MYLYLSMFLFVCISMVCPTTYHGSTVSSTDVRIHVRIHLRRDAWWRCQVKLRMSHLFETLVDDLSTNIFSLVILNLSVLFLRTIISIFRHFFFSRNLTPENWCFRQVQILLFRELKMKKVISSILENSDLLQASMLVIRSKGELAKCLYEHFWRLNSDSDAFES